MKYTELPLAIFYNGIKFDSESQFFHVGQFEIDGGHTGGTSCKTSGAPFSLDMDFLLSWLHFDSLHSRPRLVFHRRVDHAPAPLSVNEKADTGTATRGIKITLFTPLTSV